VEHVDEVWAVTFSPDGRRIVSGSRDTSVRVWDPGTGQQVGKPIFGHSDRPPARPTIEFARWLESFDSSAAQAPIA
jgi:WD40 repeat protein